ncbi:uncharacterized protein [Triticum aestivum]|uniref:uncharacterized protein n=1 Tax=Triticum aestivum TaxID=4565 RepID=UPI001D00A0F8|nr:uncharacterized protein LOC123184630 [Triticum aestivum]
MEGLGQPDDRYRQGRRRPPVVHRFSMASGAVQPLAGRVQDLARVHLRLQPGYPLPPPWLDAKPDRQHKLGCRLRHVSGVRIYVELHALSNNYIFAVTEGLFVLHDKKSTDIARLLNPLTGSLTEFPPITKVRAYDGSELKSSQAINALKLYFSDPNVLFCYSAGIDDSTSPPTLVFGVINDGELHVLYAKPGDHHWVSVHNLPNWAMWPDIGGLAWYFTPPPGVWLPKKIYVYSLGDS